MPRQANEVLAVVVNVCRKPGAVPYALTRTKGEAAQRSVTFSVTSASWLGQGDPRISQLVYLKDVFATEGGARAAQARPVPTEDLSEPGQD